jgi:hypothetical protein
MGDQAGGLMPTRFGLGLVGVAAAVYGVVLLLDLGWDNLVATATWLVGGLILHDAVLAPATVLVCLAGLSLGRWRGAFAAGLLTLGTITLTAVPVLSGRGVRADNPTLLDRPYWTGWFIVLGLVCLGVAVMGWLTTRRHPQQEETSKA